MQVIAERGRRSSAEPRGLVHRPLSAAAERPMTAGWCEIVVGLSHARTADERIMSMSVVVTNYRDAGRLSA
ncbi:hypothetical protein [Micromonospora luteifusca]|uniref:hypothetical protein n=1 Tax=Micromonospora luteifusca TaxID=709860 RepID=UPI0033B17605